MNRSFLVLPFILAIGCSTYDDSSSTGDDTAVESGSDDIVWGEAAGSSSDTTTTDDSGGTTDDSGDDTGGLPTDDTADTDSGVVTGPITAKVYIHEVTASTDVAMYVANVSENDWSEYSSSFAVNTDDVHPRGDGWLSQYITYTPGQIIAANGAWSDGTSNARFLAEAGDLLTNIDYVLMVFEDGTYEIYDIGTSTGVGDVAIYDGSYVDGSGNTVNTQDFYVYTTLNTTGDYDL